MKCKAFLAAVSLGLCCLAGSVTLAQSIDAMPPVVVKTVPQAGRTDIAPGVTEIRVTFSKDMADGSWSWSSAWQDSTPAIIGRPYYEPDHRTAVLKAKLEPGQTYGYWLNSEKFRNFKDRQGHPAVPYLLVFHTSAAPALPTTQPSR